VSAEPASFCAALLAGGGGWLRMITVPRTGGSGKWSVTATTNWTVFWQSNVGASGADALTATTADQWDVGEYRTVLVQGSGG